MMTARHPFHALWMALLGLIFACSRSMVAAQAAKSFPVSQFSYYISDYEAELAKLSKSVTKTKPEIETDIAAAEAAGNQRLAAAAIEQLITKEPSNPALWLQLATALSEAEPINDSDGYTLPSQAHRRGPSRLHAGARCRGRGRRAGHRRRRACQARDTGARRCWPTRKA